MLSTGPCLWVNPIKQHRGSQGRQDACAAISRCQRWLAGKINITRATSPPQLHPHHHLLLLLPILHPQCPLPLFCWLVNDSCAWGEAWGARRETASHCVSQRFHSPFAAISRRWSPEAAALQGLFDNSRALVSLQFLLSLHLGNRKKSWVWCLDYSNPHRHYTHTQRHVFHIHKHTHPTTPLWECLCGDGFVRWNKMEPFIILPNP